MKVLLTGGAGYIGSHTTLALLRAGHDVFVVDNHRNSSPVVLDRVRALSGRDFGAAEIDICDAGALAACLAAFRPDCVIHFAGLKAVAESIPEAVEYYRVNVGGTISLLQAMDLAECRKLIFSSSATIYGTALPPPFAEDHPIAPSSPYGRTKAQVEQIVTDWVAAADHRGAVLLRYFNPVGADPSGQIGEDPRGIPNNLMPYVLQVVAGRREELLVFGDDYDTPDGSGERDYIHVVDLARGHIAALDYVMTTEASAAFNLGTGRGVTVREVLRTFEAATGCTVAHRIVGRRPGDVGSSVADVAKAAKELGWRAQETLADACLSGWNWQRRNPDGYGPHDR